jgi:hypothetical protein
MVRTDLLRRGAPWVALLLRTRRSSRTLNLGWPHRVSALAALAATLALVARRPRAAIAAASALVALNHPLYRLLLRRGGPRVAAAGIGLHVVHHLTGIAAVPLGVTQHLREHRSPMPARTED